MLNKQTRTGIHTHTYNYAINQTTQQTGHRQGFPSGIICYIRNDAEKISMADAQG